MTHAPPCLERLSTLIGPGPALTLCERLPGVRLYIPLVPTSGSRLVLAIGHGPAAKLCDAMPGEILELPTRTAMERAKRRDAILFDLATGQPSSAVAQRHGVSYAYVRTLKARAAHA